MPEISRFLGIIIRMYFSEHAPPHFHAYYQDYTITVNIDNGEIEGKFPKRALRLVLEWLDLHKDELMQNWNKAQAMQDLSPIAPLE